MTSPNHPPVTDHSLGLGEDGVVLRAPDGDGLSSPTEPARGLGPSGFNPSRIERGHVCEHGIRWPHACAPCDDAAWAAHVETGGLVLSLFPGIGMLDTAFEAAGFTVVRGPDLLWGGDVRSFNPPAGRFDGIIGGPPCQFASEMSRFNAAMGKDLADNLIPEFERIVAASGAPWFVMENVVQAPAPKVVGYTITENVLRDHWVGGETMRQRRLSIGTLSGDRVSIPTLPLHRNDPELAVTSGAREDRFGRPKHLVAGEWRVCSTRGPRLPIDEMARRQGLPPHFFGENSPFTDLAKRKMLGNGVPLAMGAAAAKAIAAHLRASERLAA